MVVAGSAGKMGIRLHSATFQSFRVETPKPGYLSDCALITSTLSSCHFPRGWSMLRGHADDSQLVWWIAA